MPKLEVRPMQESDVDHVVNYWKNGTDADFLRMGVDRSKFPPFDIFRKNLLATISANQNEARSFYMVWLVDNEPIGYSSLKDIMYGDHGGMHLHMWTPVARGKGYGATLFCLSALEFYDRFKLKTIHCEPCSVNPMPNRMFQKVGFELEKTYVAASSDLSAVCELNRYVIAQDRVRSFLSSAKRIKN